MRLQGRNLTVRMRGKDVELLQGELGRLGWPLEDKAGYFGRTTRLAVQELQRRHGLAADGIVDKETAALISRLVKKERPRTYRVRGHVRQSNGAPLAGVTVLALDQDLAGENVLGETQTGADGRYEIAYTAEQFRRTESERGGAGLILRVLDSKRRVLATSPRKNNARPDEQIDFTVDVASPEEHLWIVRGQVSQTEGNAPLPGIIVRAWTRSLHEETALGEATTDQSGRYVISYSPPNEDEPPDLIVRAYHPQQRSQVLAESHLITDAPRELTVDLKVSAGDFRAPSEYERFREQLEPFLKGLDPAELDGEKLTYLAAKSGLDAQQIASFVQSARLAGETDIPAPVFYGFFRRNLPLALDSLLAQHPDVRREALLSAARNNLIPASFAEGEQLADVERAQERAVARSLLERPLVPERASLRELLDTATESPEQQQAFASACARHKGTPEQFWETLRGDDTLQGQVGELQVTLQLGALAGGHLPLVRELQRMRRAGDFSEVRDLARKSQDEWERIIASEGIGAPADIAGDDGNGKVQRYARAITHMLEDAFPTTFLAARIAESKLEGKEDLETFLTHNTGFKIEGARLETYLAGQGGRDPLAGIPEGPRTKRVKEQIRSLQRLNHVVERPRLALSLLQPGLTSAHDITRLGPTVFQNQYADSLGGNSVAQFAYERAEQVAGIAFNLLADYGFGASKVPLPILPAGTVAADDSIPDLRTLFGSLELCECEHCRSVYGPAAYLVDILHFLSDRKLVDQITTTTETEPDGTELEVVDKVTYKTDSAADVLLKRRPDLQEIELTCENTNIPLPYVDTVNEVLEEAISPLPSFAAFTLNAALQDDLDERTVSATLSQAFTQAGYRLSEHTGIVVVRPGKWWIVEDLPRSYTVRLTNGQLQVVRSGRQTRGTAQERAANPQYMIPAAYEVLARQVSPLGYRNLLYPQAAPTSLPFNLWVEEIRAYLRHLGVERYELMETLLPGDREELLEDENIAHDYLGLTPEEALLVNGKATGQPGATSPGVWNLWGFKKGNLDSSSAIPDPTNSTQWITTSAQSGSSSWLSVLTERVDVFLQQSGMTYLELLALLGCYVVSPDNQGTRKIYIVSCDEDAVTCDPAEMQLDGFDQTTASLAARFIRLWRKLGWTLRDLDRVMLAFGSASQNPPYVTPPDLDDDLLAQLSHVTRLHRALGVPVDRLSAWWAANMDSDNALREWWTLSYRDHDAPGQPVLPSLYDRLFRNKVVINPPDPAFTEDPSDLAGTLSARRETITAALGISAADFILLLDDEDVIPRQGADPTKPDDVLKLAYLSELHRHVGLARALKLSIRDYLSLLKLMNAEPFASTLDTVRFVERVEHMRASGFTVSQLDYLLRHEYTKATGVAPTEQQIAVVLNDVRAGLQSIAAEHTFVEDPSDARGLTVDSNGELTRKKLALLNWDSDLIEQAVTMLADTAVYEADLDSLPVGVTLPNDTGAYAVTCATAPGANDIPKSLVGVVYYDTSATELRCTRRLTSDEGEELLAALSTLHSEVTALLAEPGRLQGKISYSSDTQKLRFTGVMTTARHTRLLQVTGDQDYQDAIGKLYAAPRNFASLYMKVFGVAAQDFSVELPQSIAGVIFPEAVQKKVYYDEETRELHFGGVMTDQERAILRGISDYQVTINELYAVGVITQTQQNLLLPLAGDASYPQSIKNLCTGGDITTAQQTLLLNLTNDADYQEAIGALCTNGGITAAQKTDLLALSADVEYLDAIDALYAAPRNAQPLSSEESITSSDQTSLFDNSTEPQARFKIVLKKLLPYLLRTLSERLVKQKLSEALGLEAKVADELLTKQLEALGSTPAQQLPAIADFLEPALAKSSPKTLPESARFPHAFRGYLRLHKIALVLSRCELKGAQVGWLFRYGTAAEWLDITSLPLDAGKLTPQELEEQFEAWERLVELVQVRDILPTGATVLADILTIVNSKDGTLDDLLERLCLETKWDEEEAGTILGADGFSLTYPDDYKAAHALLRLAAAFSLLKRLGMAASQGQALTLVQDHQLLLDTLGQLLTDEATIESRVAKLQKAGQGVVQAARAKYDEDRWLQIVKPLRDVLREQQRAALVAYLVTHPKVLTKKGGKTSPAWRDVNDLFAYFLIDVEMSPCQLTARIKQAAGTVQLFVQRCLMNLESEVNTGSAFDVRWREWGWMKNYRIWEANRKVFLYPENWIEPELREDKSPFFKELESELLQADLSQTPDETDVQLKIGNPVEAAFMQYLQKLDEVARLEIVGEYHQQEWDASENLVVDLLHVFGRTRGTPHVYYYRQRVDSSYWTAWEKVDVDIEGDHLIPVVWNRRLYLFWPIFTEKQVEQAVTMPAENGTLEEPQKYWQIQLAWSEYQGGAWSPKKVSTTYHDGSDYFESKKSEYLFRTFDTGDDELSIRMYVRWTPHKYIPLARFGLQPGRSDVTVKKLYTKSGGAVNFIAGEDWYFPTMYGTEVDEMMQVESSSANDQLLLPTDGSSSAALEETPGTYRLLTPHQDEDFDPEEPFFFQDGTRTFFINRETETTTIEVELGGLLRPDAIGLNSIGTWLEKYLAKAEVKPGPRPPIPALEGVLAHTGDPLAFVSSFPVKKARSTIAIGMGERGLGRTAAYAPPALRDAATDSRALITVPRVLRSNVPTWDLLTGIAIQDFSTSAALFDRVLGSGLRAHEVLTWWLSEAGYHFYMFHHPYVSNLIRHLNRDGVPGLLQRQLQLMEHFFFDKSDGYAPTSLVLKGQPSSDDPAPRYPRDDVDFSYGGAYELYNWELFFHIPLLIADRLSKDQRFSVAQKWFHYIFDPTDKSNLAVPQRYWQTRPFYETSADEYWSQSIVNMMRYLAGGVSATTFSDLEKRVQDDLLALPKKVAQWRKRPFRPHLIARLRTTAYQKTVVMKYLDNLIAWGDQLFRRDTIESINEATQLYILAAEILGARPQTIPPRAVAEVQTYRTIKAKLDDFSNALVAIEEFIPPSAARVVTVPAGASPHVTLPDMLYFCVPKNDKLLAYWDTVADRLFKVRHCMNIEGVVRQLPLYEPPIDPALLVRAVAAGIDISSVLNDINAALPHYRFNVMLQKAVDLCAEVKALGGALLVALEKRDAEALALLRSTHEIVLLKVVRLVKEQQVKEAKEALDALNKGRELANLRYQHYSGLAFTNPAEERHLSLVDEALGLQEAQSIIELIANVLCLIPDFKVGCPTTIGATLGGSGLGGAMKAMSGYLGSLASINQTRASLSATMASHQRRWEEWKLQERLAAKELEQIDKQILGAQIRRAIAEQELKNQDVQIENAQKADTFMHDKFTNQELYSWMVGQVASVYFQSYQLTYDVAKRAERAYRHELGLRDSSLIQFGYWDSLKKGLLAGERLFHDLKRLEVAYLEQNKREYELTRHVSLRQLDSAALIQLRQTGSCTISLDEALYDLDCPGHYLRRLKSVSLTIPCVTGPYTSVNATLTLLKSSIRYSSTLLSGKYARDIENEDSRFTDSYGTVESIVTSSGQNDSGMFELNLRDDRYLPFEGAGAISDWRIDLPSAFRQFDYDTIADVVLHVRYTAREGGDQLRQQATSELYEALGSIAGSEEHPGLVQLFSLRHDFPDEFHKLLYSVASTQVTLKITEAHFPFFVNYLPGYKVAVQEAVLVLQTPIKQTTANVRFTLAGTEYSGFVRDSQYGNLWSKDLGTAFSSGIEGKHVLEVTNAGDLAPAAGTGDGATIDPQKLTDIFLAITYNLEKGT